MFILSLSAIFSRHARKINWLVAKADDELINRKYKASH